MLDELLMAGICHPPHSRYPRCLSPTHEMNAMQTTSLWTTLLRENPNTWGCYSVLNVLYSLIQRSQISEQLAAMKRGEDASLYAGEYGNRPLYKMLGYFSIIGLLRVHCLLGDFSLALKTLDDIEASCDTTPFPTIEADAGTWHQSYCHWP